MSLISDALGDVGGFISKNKNPVSAVTNALGAVGGAISPKGGSFQWGQTFINNLASFGTLGIYPLYNKVTATIDTTINTGKNLITDVENKGNQILNTGTKVLTDLEGAGSKIIDTGQKVLTDLEGAGNKLVGDVSGLTDSAKNIMDSFANALKNLKLPSSLGNITMPSISLPNISLSLGGLSDQLSGATSGGTSLTTMAVIGGAVALGAFLLLR